MRKEYTVEERVNNRVWWYTFTDLNNKGEQLVIELSKCENCGGSHALPVLWKQHSYIDRVLETYWCISTYVTDTEGQCWIMYNPQSKRSEDGKRAVVNFDWMFEATEENKEKLINETYRLWSEASGETATETKHRKVREFAQKYDLEVVTEIPEGWIKTNYATDPRGAQSVCNMKATIKAIHDGTYQRKLLLV